MHPPRCAAGGWERGEQGPSAGGDGGAPGGGGAAAPGRGRHGCPRSRRGRRGRVAPARPGTALRGNAGGQPGTVPAAVPAPRPALTMLRAVRAVPAARCGGARLGAELRLLQSPPQRSLIGGRGLLLPRPLIWVHLHAVGLYPLRGLREPGGVLPAAEEARVAGSEASPPALPGGRPGQPARLQAEGLGDQPAGVTGSAEPPAPEPEQVQ